MNELPTPQTEQESQPTWQRPQITRIDIRRTMISTGSFNDGGGAFTFETGGN
ncbi:MAG: hypothetical protein JW726_15320 [Anaerolineales bacterium]|nr:hypothetical protein [Anaerolineales bacterium]